MAEETKEHDVDALLRKNAELLGEVKTLKAKVAEIEAERDGANEAKKEAEATMQQTLLDKPTEEALAPMFSLPWRHIKPLIAEHFTFELGEDGKPIAKAVAGGDSLDMEATGKAFFTIPDIAAALKPGQGGGSKGSDGRMSDFTPPEKPKEKVASPFGLR